MENILNENEALLSMTKRYIKSRDRISAAVDMHRRAIQLVCLLNQIHLKRVSLEIIVCAIII